MFTLYKEKLSIYLEFPPTAWYGIVLVINYLEVSCCIVVMLKQYECNKTCHRDRIASLTAPCLSHKKRKNFNVLLTPPTPMPGLMQKLFLDFIQANKLQRSYRTYLISCFYLSHLALQITGLQKKNSI